MQILLTLRAITEKMASAAEEMPDSAVVCECKCNVTRRCEVIRMYALAPNNSVIGLKRLCGKKDCRPKASNMCREVDKEVKFWFIEPAWCPANYAIEEFCDHSLKLHLKISICGTRMRKNIYSTHNVFVDIWDCSLPEKGD